MNTLTCKHWIINCVLVSFFSSFNTANADESIFGYRIFEIQKKHALKGSTLAQYKLGTFYEFGISVKPNPQEAIVWYKKAADKHNKPAANRLMYLDIKLNGYKSSHTEWLNKIKDETQKNNIHSTIVLGQLNHYGLGVKKNLPVAFKLLRKASVNGHTEIDFEIDAIQKQIAASKLKVKVSQPKIKIAKTKSKSKLKPKSKLKQNELIKRKKYEKAMHKLYQNQLILQQQQEWSEGVEWAEEGNDE